MSGFADPKIVGDTGGTPRRLVNSYKRKYYRKQFSF